MYVFLLLFIFNFIDCTVDLNLSEIEYIANQLTPLECEKLNEYLHTNTYEITTKKFNFFSFGDRDCLEILIHWNSTPNEGLDETHAILCHRLNQVGRKDLAEWLSTTVFSRLGKGLNKSVLTNPFKGLIKEVTELPEAEAGATGNNSDLSFYHGEPEWETYDTVAVVVAIVLFIAIAILIFELCGCFKLRQKKKKKVKYLKNEKYSLLPQEEGSLTGEDENVNKH